MNKQIKEKPNFKISIAIYGPLTNKGISGLGYFNYQVVHYFLEKGMLEKVFCLVLKDKRENIDIPSSKLEVATDNLFFKVKYYGLRAIHRLIKTFNDRYYSEITFDRYVHRRISFNQVDVLLCLKPVLPLLIRKARESQVLTVSLADIAHPQFIYEMVKQIEKRYGVQDNSSYTHHRRIKRLISSFENSKLVIPRVSSQFIYKTYLDKGIYHIHKLRSQNGINMDLYKLKERFNKAQEIIHFVSVAQFNLKKGVPLLLEVWKELTQEGHFPAHLHIIGSLDFSTRKVIAKYFKDIPQVTIHGYTQQIFDVYPKYDVFIASSISDLGPRTVIEAMARGLPVIASKHCGTADLVEEEANGFTYDPFDTATLKSLITWFIHNRDRIEPMGRKANEKVKNLGYNNFLDEMYQAILEKYAPGEQKNLIHESMPQNQV